MMSYVAGLAVCPAPMGATMAPSKSPVNAVLRKLSLPAERPVRSLSFSVFAIGILLVLILMPRRFLGSHASSVLRLRFLGSHASSVLRLRFLGSHASSVLRLRFLGSHASSVLRLASWDRTLPACSGSLPGIARFQRAPARFLGSHAS